MTRATPPSSRSARARREVTGPSQNVVVHAHQVVTFTGIDELVAHFDTAGSRPMNSIPGVSIAIGATSAWLLPARRNTSHPTSRVTKISTTTARGARSPSTVTCGRRRASPWAGRRTVTAAGYGSRRGAGPGSMMRRWGYAPFHYGRWAHVRNRWCWVPGPRHMRAVYAPALVGWVGSPGAHVSWFPLGPREVYSPGRRYSRHYFERVNVSNTVIVNRSHFTRALEQSEVELHLPQPRGAGRRDHRVAQAFTSAGRVHEHRDRGNEAGFANAPATAVAPQHRARAREPPGRTARARTCACRRVRRGSPGRREARAAVRVGALCAARDADSGSSA